jgi:hypothetical protein
MNKTKSTPLVNPAAGEDVTTDEVIEAGEDAIAKYADGLETTDEAVAALNTTDRQLQKVRRRKRKRETRPRTTKDVRATPRRATRKLKTRKTKAATRATTKKTKARTKRR